MTALSVAGRAGLSGAPGRAQDALGGLLRRVRRNLEGDDVQAYLAETISQVESNPAITVHLGATVESTDGFVGNFKTRLNNGAVIEHGAILIATGGAEYTPDEYGYNDSERIITQRELEDLLAEREPAAGETYVMIQCVGSREEPANYCSRICCQDALKNSIAIKKSNPAATVIVLYRDMRAYGLKEDYYKQARDLGVLFFLFTPEEKPVVETGGEKLRVSLPGKILGKEMVIEAGLCSAFHRLAAAARRHRICQKIQADLQYRRFFTGGPRQTAAGRFPQ